MIMATGKINQPIDSSDMYWKPGDSFSISMARAIWPCVCSTARELRWCIPLYKPVRSDVTSVVLTGDLAIRASGKGQTNYNPITGVSVAVTNCGLLCNYVASSAAVNSIQEVVNVSPRGTRITVTFS